MKTKQIIIALVALIGFSVMLAVPTALAIDNCGNTTTIIDCSNIDGKSGTEATGLWSLLLTAVNIFTAGIGIVAVAGIVYGSIIYASAGDDAAKVKKAREIIRNVVIGIVMYALTYAVLNFIIPGGLFTGTVKPAGNSLEKVDSESKSKSVGSPLEKVDSESKSKSVGSPTP